MTITLYDPIRKPFTRAKSALYEAMNDESPHEIYFRYLWRPGRNTDFAVRPTNSGRTANWLHYYSVNPTPHAPRMQRKGDSAIFCIMWIDLLCRGKDVGLGDQASADEYRRMIATQRENVSRGEFMLTSFGNTYRMNI